MITYRENSVIIDSNERNERRLMTKQKGFTMNTLSVTEHSHLISMVSNL